jgi:ribosomal protein S18 acetylase RimI-like enzyme
MDFQFQTLTKEFMIENVREFISMTESNIIGEYWQESHFLAVLPGKWEYSFYVTDPEEKIAGFIIASEKEQSIHIHKFVVHKPFQNRGLGSKMIDRILQQTNQPVTLKVQVANEDALRFYLRKGFIVTGQQKDLHTMIYER